MESVSVGGDAPGAQYAGGAQRPDGRIRRAPDRQANSPFPRTSCARTCTGARRRPVMRRAAGRRSQSSHSRRGSDDRARVNHEPETCRGSDGGRAAGRVNPKPSSPTHRRPERAPHHFASAATGDVVGVGASTSPTPLTSRTAGSNPAARTPVRERRGPRLWPTPGGLPQDQARCDGECAPSCRA